MEVLLIIILVTVLLFFSGLIMALAAASGMDRYRDDEEFERQYYNLEE